MSHLLWQLQEPGGQTVTEKILYNRGVKPEEAEAFLEADSHLLYSPHLLPDIHKAIARVYKALLRGEKIAIYGDFDTDGITAAVILTEGLRLLGADIIPYIPHRLEGHGLNIKALENLFQQGATLVITADCGTACYKEVAFMQKKGLDIIITDHHSCSQEIPPALAVINPELSPYPFPYLSGAGVAYKFVQALLEGMDKEVEGLLELVALGTITDVVPLIGENRYLVKEGLRRLNDFPRLGVKELISTAGLQLGQIDTHNVAWILGPRLNAAGRMEHARLSYQLLLTSVPKEAEELAKELERKNAERQKILDRSLSLARELALAQKEEKLLFICGEFEPGICGLVASKLMDEFYRPAAVVRIYGETMRVSMRSIPEFNLIEALTECAHLLSGFGGHPTAAGFSAPAKNLDQIKLKLQEKAAQRLAALELRPKVKIDALIPLSEIDRGLICFCRRLAPFGVGNPQPVFLSQRVKLLDARLLSSGEHLRLKFKDERGVIWDGVGFGIGDHYLLLSSYLDVVYQLRLNERTSSSLELNILDLRPS